MYPIGRITTLTGVSAKALYLYERHGLLKPRRTRAGYRRYTIRDLLELERIVALKALGLPLKQIAELTGDAARLAALLAQQRTQLEEKRRRIDRTMRAIEAIERDGDPGSALERFVSESSWERWEAKRQSAAAGVVRAPDRASPSRLELFREIASALDRDPTGESARPLVASWDALLDRETGGDADMNARRRRSWAGRRRWPDGMRRYVASLYETEPSAWERVADFIDDARRGS